MKRVPATFVNKPIVTDEVGAPPRKKKSYDANRDTLQQIQQNYYRLYSVVGVADELRKLREQADRDNKQ